MPTKGYIQYISKSRRPSIGHRTGKGQSSSQFPRRVVLKNVLTIGLRKGIGFRKGRETRGQIANIGSSKKQESSRKTSTFALLTMPNPLTVWITTNCGKFFKRWKYQTSWPASWEICMQVKKQQLELDMQQQTGCKLGKEYIKAVYCHPAYLTSMQSTSCGILGWMNHKLESRLLGEI